MGTEATMQELWQMAVDRLREMIHSDDEELALAAAVAILNLPYVEQVITEDDDDADVVKSRMQAASSGWPISMMN